MKKVAAADAERVGPEFSVDGMLIARRKTRELIEHIAKMIEPGMLEEDAVALAKKTLVAAGLEQTWHPTRVRFGRNTMRGMKEASEPGAILRRDDIFFLDMAPRYQAWEGDGGKCFTVGANPEHARCARDAEALFHEARLAWTNQHLTGEQLYAFADRRAREMGWELNFDLPGHRLSDFPHAAIHTGSLADAEFKPAPLRWILEIHIRDPKGRFGGFFEDMLLDDGFYLA